jgi:hypothetical protein
MRKLLTILCLLVALKSNAQVISGTMDNWHSYTSGIFPPVSLEAPNGWFGSDSLACFFGPFLDPGGSFVKQIFKTTDKHSGSFAAKLVTTEQGSFGALPGVLANAAMTLDTTGGNVNVKFSGGTSVTQRLDYANAWVKYNPGSTGEEGMMMVEAVLAGAGANGEDSVVGMGQDVIPASTTYSAHSVNITYLNTTVIPNKIRVMFYSSSPDGSLFTDGSELFVDEVTVSLFPVQITRVFDNDFGVKVYPTAGSGIVKLEPQTVMPLKLAVYNVSGREVAVKQFSGSDAADLTALPQGMYFYSIFSDNRPVQKGKLTIVK